MGRLENHCKRNLLQTSKCTKLKKKTGATLKIKNLSRQAKTEQNCHQYTQPREERISETHRAGNTALKYP